MGRTDGVAEVLGGRKVFRQRVASLDDLREEIRRGLPVSALDAVVRALDLATSDVSTALRIPPRTIARRKKQRNLAPDESDRLYRLARVGAIAVRVLGSEEKAARWLRHPNRALGGPAPLSLLDTAIGARQVEDLLGRIDHGVLS